METIIKSEYGTLYACQNSVLGTDRFIICNGVTGAIYGKVDTERETFRQTRLDTEVTATELREIASFLEQLIKIRKQKNGAAPIAVTA